jgi:hypothetical protein
MRYRDSLRRASEQVKFGLDMGLYQDKIVMPKGKFIFDMRDAKTGEQLAYFEKENLIVLDAGVFLAWISKDNPTDRSMNMLAVGTGATGNILNPDAPTNIQRSLNECLAWKAFSSTNFVDASGVAVSYTTHVVDFTATFGASEAVGPLNEMGIMSSLPGTSSEPLPTSPIETTDPYNPTVDITIHDVLINYLPYPVISKPSYATLSITWRLSF